VSTLGGAGVYKSLNYGASWTAANSGLTDSNYLAVANNGTVYLAGSNGSGIFRSTNAGVNWTQANSGLTNLYVNTIKSYGSYFLAGTLNGIFKSSNGGLTWIKISEGLYNPYIYSITFRGGLAFAGTYGNAVYARPVSEIITSVSGNEISPDKYTLSQNYPNPFNPSTTIEFNLPKSGFVTLKVFDLTGREVAVLYNQTLNQGLYQTDFNPGNLASGIYIYSVIAKDDFTGKIYKDAKRMTLIR
jgi:hypothetical protein